MPKRTVRKEMKKPARVKDLSAAIKGVKTIKGGALVQSECGVKTPTLGGRLS
jgi:hypothetical protein